jgi:hypothetical protein
MISLYDSLPLLNFLRLKTNRRIVGFAFRSSLSEFRLEAMTRDQLWQ